MSGDPQEAYLDFLEPQVGVDASSNGAYWDILNIMFAKEFV